MSALSERTKKLADSLIELSWHAADSRRIAGSKNVEIARHLEALMSLSEQQQIECLGCPLKEWVPLKLKDEKDVPRTWFYALSLVKEWRRIKHLPLVVSRISSAGLSWWKAKYVSDIMERENWSRSLGQTVSDEIAAEGRSGDENYFIKRKTEAMEKKYLETARFSWKELRDRARLQPGESDKLSLGGRVTFDEFDGWLKSVEIASVICGEDRPRRIFAEELAVVNEALQGLADAALGRKSEGEEE